MRAVQSNNPVFQRSEPLARAAQQGVGFRTPGAAAPTTWRPCTAPRPA